MNGTTALTRRHFLALSTAAFAGLSRPRGRTAANDSIHVAVIGCGERGTQHLAELVARRRMKNLVRIAAVCDVYKPRRQHARSLTGAPAYAHWQEVVKRRDVDAIVVATPDHLHAPVAVAAMDAGKDVFCELPMALTIEEAKAFRDCASATGAVVQVGTPEPFEPGWLIARDWVRHGRLGPLRWSQPGFGIGEEYTTSTARASATPFRAQDLDWDAFWGKTPRTARDPQRYFFWQDFWEYSGGSAASLFCRQLAPLLLATGEEFPRRVAAAGGCRTIRKTPDRLLMTLAYPSDLTIVLSTTTTRRGEVPTVIRGEKGAILCSPEGLVFCREDGSKGLEYRSEGRGRGGPLGAWLECVRTRRRCIWCERLGFRATVAVLMGLAAYRSCRALSWDPNREEVVPAAIRR